MAMSQELHTLGRTVAELQDEALVLRARPALAERLSSIHRAQAKRAVAGRRRSLGKPFAVLGFAAAVLLMVLFFRSEPLRFAVGSAQGRGALGSWLAASAEAPTAIAFSDGSRVLLGAGAQARVVGVSEHGARVVVERGNVRADVVPRAGNDWWVIGGPFEIHVTGTSFDASWDPERAALRVTMYEGHVEITGSCLPRAHALSKGESATLSCSPAASPANAANAASPANPANPAPLVASAAPAPAAVTPALPGAVQSGRDARAGVAPSASGSAERAPSWRAWARLGGYKEALAAAESEGFGALCDSLSIADLLELATTARLAGQMARASEAYSAVRRRFALSDGAATAAFHLGQIAFDSARSYPEAHRWFATYLSERPAGALAAEALGRTMEAEQRMGDLDAARATASKYLQRYPSGAHVRLAKSLEAP